MKNILKQIAVVAVFITVLSCSKDEAKSTGTPTAPVQSGNCISGSIVLTQTKIENYPSSNNVFIDFDAKNNSTINYDVSTIGVGNFIYVKVKVKTTDNAIYETVQPIFAQLSAGATKSVLFQANYGAGKTYQSYTFEVICQ